MRRTLSIALLGAVAAAPALAQPQPGPPPGAADVRAFRECQNGEVVKLDDGKRAEEAVAKDLAAHARNSIRRCLRPCSRCLGSRPG